MDFTVQKVFMEGKKANPERQWTGYTGLGRVFVF
jgi:hypothetical protein